MVATAVLSTTARAKAREARKEAMAKRAVKGSMDLDSGPALERVTSHLSTTSYLSLDTVSLFPSCVPSLHIVALRFRDVSRRRNLFLRSRSRRRSASHPTTRCPTRAASLIRRLDSSPCRQVRGMSPSADRRTPLDS